MSSFPFNQEPEDRARRAETPPATGWSVEQLDQRSAYQAQQPAAYPDIDIVDDADEIIAYVDLPGFSKDEIRVRIDQRTMVIDAERGGELEDTDTVYLRERPTQVERVFQLPAAVRAGGAEAELNDGVCMISLPKAATDRYEEIRVQSD